MDDRRKLVRSGYNKCAQDYASKRELFKNQKYLENLAKYLRKQAEILDVGCGSGVPIDKFLLENGFSVTGIDISSEQIKIARQNFPKAKFLTIDMSQINFPPDSFDAIVSFYAIFHIPREGHLALFKKFHSFLKKDGYLLVTMGTEDWEGVEDNFHGAKMFWSHYGRDKNLEIVKAVGFKIINESIDISGGEKHLIIFAQKSRP